MNRVLGVMLALFITACSSSDNDVNVIKNNGYTDVNITGTSFFFSSFVCSDDAIYGKAFTAKMNGRNVEGHLCIRGYFIRNPYVRVQ